MEFPHPTGTEKGFPMPVLYLHGIIHVIRGEYPLDTVTSSVEESFGRGPVFNYQSYNEPTADGIGVLSRWADKSAFGAGSPWVSIPAAFAPPAIRFAAVGWVHILCYKDLGT